MSHEATPRPMLTGGWRVVAIWLVTASGGCLPVPAQDAALPPGSLPPPVINAMPPVLTQNCTASILNRTVPVNRGGGVLIQNIPSAPGFFRVHYLCQTPGGSPLTGQSEFFNLFPGGLITTTQLNLGVFSPPPVSLAIAAPQTTLSGAGATTQLQVTATLPSGTTKDVSSHTLGTSYISSNTNIALVGQDGLVTGVSGGVAIISATNEGVLSAIKINVSGAPAPGTGTVTGQLTLATGASAKGLVVSLLETNPQGLVGPPLISGVTNSSGAYTFSSVPIGVTFVVQSGAAISPNQMLTTSGQILTVNLIVPPQGTVIVQLLKADGTPYPNVGITESDSGHTAPFFAGTTDASGTLTIPGVYGTFGVMALDPSLPMTFGGSEGQFVGSAGGVIPSPGATVNVTINASISGTIQGTVFAGDGQTPISSADVTVFDGPIYGALSENVAVAELATVLTDASGHYQFSNFRTGTQGFKVVASYNSVNAPATGVITSPGQNLTVNVVMPLQVVQGTVSYFDGAPVSNPNVFASNINCCGNASVSTSRFVSNPTGANGSYTIFLPSPLSVGGFIAPYYLIAQDPESQLYSPQLVSVTNPAVQQNLNITLPASGTVTGTITINGTSTPYPNALVAITDSLAFFGGRQMQTGANGVYSFDHVPLGPFAIQASNEFTSVFASAAGTMSTNDSTVTVNLTQNISPNVGSVSGTVLNADGITPVPNAQVLLENLDSAGPLLNFRTGATTNAAGFYQAGNLPLGDIRVIVASPTNPNIGGLGTGIVTAGNNTTVNVTLGNAFPFGASPRLNLNGSDGFQYAVGCDGTLSANPTSGIYEGASGYGLIVDGILGSFPCLLAGTLEAGGRQIVLGPATIGSVSVTRKVFSPSTGGFVRYLEYLTNPGTTPVTVHLEVDPHADSGAATSIVIPPATTNNTYAVTDNPFNTELACVMEFGVQICTLPAGFVFGGPNGRLGVSSATFLAGLNTADYGAIAGAGLLDSDLAIPNSISYIWDVPIPPGGTAILMHFLVLRGLFDAAGAQGEAQALVSLTDPNALVGMTPADHANVVNFNVP